MTTACSEGFDSLAARRCQAAGAWGASAPADAFLAADAGAFSALGSEHVGVAGVSVAPAQVGVQGPGLHGVVGVVGVGHGELPQRSEGRLDGVGPRGVGRGEKQLDLVLLRTAADVGAPVGGQVVDVRVDGCAVRAGGADRLQRGQRVPGTPPAAVDAPQPVVADRVAAMEVAHPVGAVVGGRQSVGVPLPRPAGACGGTDRERAELVEGEDPVGEAVQHFLDPVEFRVALGVRGLLPRLGALEGDAAAGEQAP